MLKECLKNAHMPPIIDEELKLFYYRGLAEYEDEPGYLRSTCKAGQEKTEKLCANFEVK